ncbi:hypothetical protein [Cyanobacterium aponinum]|uniref:Uncharacterized protein n=1 Tax=Cyanobacterium aponinum (strain PCC 10605) TaxID=755178 RepID=K9Z467_CYAAP|nr:hypothetical protein [Cyanobacterium aponinum]AFZ53929.1 hypothetical protein Cyan10605_1827 [Cyanobacterium aponinum PCC 10605]
MKAKFNNNTSNISSIGQQARLLMVDNRQRKSNRQATMLERASEQVGLQ